MKDAEPRFIEKCMPLEGTDIQVCVRLENGSMRIDVKKSSACVYTVIIDNAEDQLEHPWLADLFSEENRLNLSNLAHEMDKYLVSTNTNQG